MSQLPFHPGGPLWPPVGRRGGWAPLPVLKPTSPTWFSGADGCAKAALPLTLPLPRVSPAWSTCTCPVKPLSGASPVPVSPAAVPSPPPWPLALGLFLFILFLPKAASVGFLMRKSDHLMTLLQRLLGSITFQINSQHLQWFLSPSRPDLAHHASGAALYPWARPLCHGSVRSLTIPLVH